MIKYILYTCLYTYISYNYVDIKTDIIQPGL